MAFISKTPFVWLLLLAGTVWVISSTYDFDGVLWFLILVVAFFAGFQLKSLEKLMTAFGVLMLASTLLCFWQLIEWKGPTLSAVNVPSAFFYNKEVLAELAAPIAVWFLLKRPFNPIFAVSAIAPLVLCRERVAVFAAAIGFLYGLKLPIWRLVPDGLIIGLLGIAALLYSPARWGSALTRFEIWRETVTAITVWGHGLGWFKMAFPEFGFAHSDVLQMMAEFGVASVLFFAIPVIYFVQKRGNRIERAVLAVVCCETTVSFLFEVPVNGFLAATVLGYLARR